MIIHCTYVNFKVALTNLLVRALAWDLVVKQLLGARLDSLQHLAHIVVAGTKATNAWHADVCVSLLDLEIQRSLRKNKSSTAWLKQYEHGTIITV